MNVRVIDGRYFSGTPLQIVRALRDTTWAQREFTDSQYIDWAVANVLRGSNLELHVSGETDEERANSLLSEMLRTGLAERVSES